MQQESDDKPTKEEVFRDFRIFKLNHDMEKLFRYDHFSDIMAEKYSIPRIHLKTMKDIEQVVFAHSLSQFVDVLFLCDGHLQGRDAKADLRSLIHYAMEGL